MGKKEFDWEYYLKKIIELNNPIKLFDELEEGFYTYPLNPGIKVIVDSGYSSDVDNVIYMANTTDEHKLEFLNILEVKNESIWETKENKKLVEKWVKQKRKLFKQKGTFNEVEKTQSEPQPTPEPIIENIDSQNAMQTVYLLIKTGFKEYLTENKGLSDTQAYKVMGTLTKVNWDLIRRYYNGYKNGKDFPDQPNNNNPDNENTRVWFTNLISEYKIKLTE